MARLFAFALCLSALIWAQDSRGRLAGRVLDSSGSVIPGVTVVVTNTETGVRLTSMTNEAGT